MIEVLHGCRAARAPDPLFGNRFSVLAAGADEHTVIRDEEVMPQEAFSAAPQISSRGSHSRDGRMRLLLVNQDRFVTQTPAGNVVETPLDKEVDATAVDPTMATVADPDSFSDLNTESVNSIPIHEDEVEPEPAGLRMTLEVRDALVSVDVVDLQSVFRRRACVMKRAQSSWSAITEQQCALR